METAKIDIRKLQLLNDRINNTIDALNQVRMSVHGLAHANPMLSNVSTLGYGFNPIAFNPLNVAPPAWTSVPTAFSTPVAVNPLTQNPLATANLWTGLSHTTAETNADLSLLARINQTFPFAYSAVPGTISL